MAWRSGSIAALALTLCTTGDVANAGDETKPFPVDRTQILKSGGVYVVEGRVRIPKGIEITVQKDTKVVGGTGGGIIEVVGELVLHGVDGGRIPLDNVTIELQPKFEGVRTDMVIFKGASLGIVSPKDLAVDGRLSVQNCEFEGTSTVDVTACANDIDFQRVKTNSAVRIKGVPPAGYPVSKVKVMIMNCSSGSPTAGAIHGGMVIEGVPDVTVRGCQLGGDKVSFIDCGIVTFDANWVKCKTLEFTQSAAGRFGRTTISKCDVECEKIVLYAPASAGKSDTVACDKCWFGGETKERVVREKYFKDHDDDPTCSVTVNLLKIMEKPLNLAGSVNR